MSASTDLHSQSTNLNVNAFTSRISDVDRWKTMSADERTHRDRLLAFLLERINYERLPARSLVSSNFKLQRMALLLEHLDHPERSIPVVHIAGTKGKGSTAIMAAELLSSAGVRTGLFTSPHLHRFEERMTINGCWPSVEQLEVSVHQLLPVLAKLDAGWPEESPTFFEVCTALAWLVFQQAGVEAAVLEVGLGGRLDATNLCQPEVCVISSISRDHTQLLGQELSSIAREKAGIIKPGIPVVSGVTDPLPRDVIRDVARANQSRLLELEQEIRITTLRRVTRSPGNPLLCEQVSVELPDKRCESVTVPAPGSHQSRNAALALAAVDLFLSRTTLGRQPWQPQSLSMATLPLRTEICGLDPLLILDGAHNEASLQAVIDVLETIPVSQRRLIFGISRDKDAEAMLRVIEGQFAHVILTAYQTNPRAYPVEDLGRLAERTWSCQSWSSRATPAMALAEARQKAQPCDAICVTGSIFLAAEIRELLHHG